MVLSAALAGLIGTVPLAAAGGWPPATRHDPAKTFNETWAGAEVTENAWSAHLGSVFAPFGSIREDGLRLRAGVGYGQFRYSGYERVAGKLVAAKFYGVSTFTDVLIGYQFGVGALTVKAYVGGAYDKQVIDPFDPSFEPEGGAFGFKGALETWLNIGRVGFAQLDANWTSAHQVYASRLRLGYRLTEALSFGLEGGAHGNIEHSGGKGGAFLRYEWAFGEVSLAGGVTGTLERHDTPYASLSVLVRY